MPIFKKDSISVIIPSFNCAEFLSEAINSVLRQSTVPLEIIIVDDGSTDETGKLCSCYGDKIEYYYQENRGASAARNFGLTKSRSELVAFLDADDEFLVNALETLKESLISIENNMVSIGSYQEIVRKDWLWKKHKKPYRGAYLSGIMFRKKVFQITGILDQKIKVGEDIDWFFRLREHKVPIAYISELVVLYRRHGKNISNNKSEIANVLLKGCRDSLLRRRHNELDRFLSSFGQ